MIYLPLALLIMSFVAAYYLYMSPSSQLFGRVHYKLRTTKKQIALTFDDGPNEPYTSELLKILKKHRVTATFFVCGACVEKHPDSLKRIHTAGHNIGNHSHDHDFWHYSDTKLYRSEIQKTTKLIKDLTGAAPAFYRSPWLYRTPELLRMIRSLNLIPIWGRFGSEVEIFQPSPRLMARRAKRLLTPGAIIIFHDGRESRGGFRGNTVLAVDQFIADAKKRGFSFVTISKDLL